MCIYSGAIRIGSLGWGRGEGPGPGNHLPWDDLQFVLAGFRKESFVRVYGDPPWREVSAERRLAPTCGLTLPYHGIPAQKHSRNFECSLPGCT